MMTQGIDRRQFLALTGAGSVPFLTASRLANDRDSLLTVIDATTGAETGEGKVQLVDDGFETIAYWKDALPLDAPVSKSFKPVSKNTFVMADSSVSGRGGKALEEFEVGESVAVIFQDDDILVERHNLWP